MIVGIGVDVVNVPRFGATLKRTPGVRERLFTVAERTTGDGLPRPDASLAARFAAKEAVAKALGAPEGLRWTDCEVVSDPDGRPWLRTSGTVAEAATALGVRRWHLSLTHDGDVAIAHVVAEGEVPVPVDPEDALPVRDVEE